MKKILFLLLLITSLSYGQTIAPPKVKITANTVSTSAPYVNVQEADGYVNKINKSDLVDIIEVASAINLPSPGVAGKIYVTKDNKYLYRWNGTFYDQLAVTDISGKVDKIAGKGLSTEDYTTAEKTKLAGIQAGATANSTDAQLRDRATHTGTQAISTVMGLQAAIDAKINLTLIGANNGITPLDAGGKVPFAYLPASLMIYKGMWNPATNTPTLSDGTGVAGWVYKASVNGTVNLGSGNIDFVANDFAIHNGTKWEISKGTDAVVSVNGKQGVVSLNTSHIPEVTNKRYQTDSQQANNNATSPIQQQLDDKEPIISTKYDAFNKPFGTTVGTVAQGNDSRILNGQTAFGWGNHAGLYPTLTGTGATGTWGINISGNASNSALFNGYSFDPNLYDSGFDFLLARTNASADFRLITKNGLKSFLGLGSNAYSSTPYLPLSGGTVTGNLVISTNVPELTLEGTQISGKKYGLISGIVGVSNTGFSIRNQTDGINLLYIDNSSNATFSSTVTSSGFFQSSDRRLKYVHKRDGDVAYFTWKDGRDTKTHIGYIAQEMRKQFPDQVQKNEDGYLSVSYIEILVAKNRDLEKRLEALESMIKQLEKSK